MKRPIHLALWAAVASISLAAFTLPLRAADESTRTKNKGRDTTADYQTKAGGAASFQSDKTLGQVERANKLIGRDILGSDNQKLGKIDNFVVDLESGRILYVVVGSGGVLGAGEKRFAVAPGVFTDFQPNNVHLNVDKQKLEGAPRFTKDIDKEGEINKADFINQVYRYFGQNAWWQGPSAPAGSGEFHNVHKASDLIGMKIENVSNEKMGKVDNVMLDVPAGRVVYVVLSPDSSLSLGNNLYALPPNTLTFSADRKIFSADISKEKLAGAPHFASNNWPTLSDPSWASQVYQYYGKQAYFQTGGQLKPTGRSDQPEKKN